MGKVLNSETFEINETMSANCRSEKTRYGFRHLVTLYENGNEVGRAKCTYSNRTWEKFEFDSVLEKLGRDEVAKFVQNRSSDRGTENLRSVGAVAMMGDIFCGTQEEKNTWKKQMLEAGLENQGLDFPEDWDTLSEKEKERRLNKAIKQIGIRR